MSQPLVTIGIPTYNRAGYFLERVLNSSLGQSYPNIEVLVSDNCSDDNTPDLVRSFSDPRLRYVRQEKNLGLFGNMNFLVKEARGDYLLVHHDDDEIDPDFIESCVSATGGRNDLGLIVTGSRVIDGDGNILITKENLAAGMSNEDFVVSWYRRQIHMFLCCCLFGTEVLRRCGGFDLRYSQFIDVAAEFRCAAEGGRVDVREAKASFREHTGSQTSSSKLDDWCRSSLALLDLACELVGERAGELRPIGLRTSADRNYRYALEGDGRLQRLLRMWTVHRHFGFGQPPSRKHLKQLFRNQ